MQPIKSGNAGVLLMFAQLVDLFKLRIGLMMSITALAGYAVTPGRELTVVQLITLVVLVIAASASAGAFNQYAERDLDAVMKRTQNRPFVTGALQHRTIWLFVICALLASSVALAWMMFNPAVAIHLFLGAFFYGVVYTLWLKRRSATNIVIGGAAGSFAVLAGAAAADPGLNSSSVLLAIVLFLWTPPHFWSLAIALHKDYEEANVPMLPVVVGDEKAAKIILFNTVLLVATSILPYFYEMGLVYLICVVIGGGYFIYKSIILVQDTNKKTAMGCFFSSLIQLTMVILGSMLNAIV